MQHAASLGYLFVCHGELFIVLRLCYTPPNTAQMLGLIGAWGNKPHPLISSPKSKFWKSIARPLQWLGYAPLTMDREYRNHSQNILPAPGWQ